MKQIILLLGFSSAGKSTIGRHAEEHENFLWIELDQHRHADMSGILYPQDRKLTFGYLHTVKSLLATSDRRGAVITCPSHIVASESQAEHLALFGINVVYLEAPADFCRFDFIQRFSSAGEEAASAHWAKYNQEMRLFLGSSPDCRNIKRVSSVVGGARRPPEKIWDSIVGETHSNTSHSSGVATPCAQSSSSLRQ